MQFRKEALLSAIMAAAIVAAILLLFGCIQQPPANDILTPDIIAQNPKAFLDKNIKVQGILGPVMCTLIACIPENICCNSCSASLEGKAADIQVSGKDCAFSDFEIGKTRIVEGVWKKSGTGYYLALPEKTATQPADKNAWLSVTPMQCETTAWDKWHSDLNRVYIRAPTEKEIMNEWLGTVLNVKMIDFGEESLGAVCEACGVCPQGTKYYIKISEKDSGKLLAMSSIQWVLEESGPNSAKVQLGINKSILRQGEILEATLSVDGNIYAGYGSWQIYKKQDGIYADFPDRCFCAMDCSSAGTQCGSQLGCSMPNPYCYKAGKDDLEYSWDLKECVSKSISCISRSTGIPTNWDCVEEESAEPGEYKISFTYVKDCLEGGTFSEQPGKIVLEKDFEILKPLPAKDYCASDSDCTKSTAGCCPCENGGTEESVNKEWLAGQPACAESGQIACPTVYLCSNLGTKCVVGKCRLG